MSEQSKAPRLEPGSCRSSGPLANTARNNERFPDNFKTPGEWTFKNLDEVIKLPGAGGGGGNVLGMRKKSYVLNVLVVTQLRASLNIHRSECLKQVSFTVFHIIHTP